MPFDPSTVEVPQGPGAPSAPSTGFDPSTASAATSFPTWGQSIGQGAVGFARGVGRGLAGDVVGAGQLAATVLPQSVTAPVATSAPGQAISRFANAPSSGVAETAGRVVGGALPFVVQPELGAGALVDAAVMGGLGGLVQPTQSGSLPSHLLGGAVGAGFGGAGGALAGTPAQQAMRALGIRIPPGRMLPLIGREWERFASRLPVLDRLIGHGRQVSLDDFNRALYDDALEPLRGLNVPVATPAGKGSAGLDQLRTTITDQLNGVLARSELPSANIAAFRQDLQPIMLDATKTMSTDTLKRFGAILNQDVIDPISMNGGRLPGARLAGADGVVAKLNGESRRLWRSEDTQEKALAAAIDRVEEALLDNATIGGGGRAQLDAARQAYARYKTLSRSGSGTRAEGQIDPETLMSELRRQNQDLFSRGGMRLQPTALQARKAGVPTVGETTPQVSPWMTAAAGAGSHYRPEVLAGALPSLLYNRPGMSSLAAAANQARRIGAGAGVAGSQAAGAITPDINVEVTAPRYRP